VTVTVIVGVGVDRRCGCHRRVCQLVMRLWTEGVGVIVGVAVGAPWPWAE